jgi:hypothetical protein
VGIFWVRIDGIIDSLKNLDTAYPINWYTTSIFQPN